MVPTLLVFMLAAPPMELPVAPPPRPAIPDLPPDTDPSLADWTPRPARGLAEPWEKATDKDWIDARFREMNTGPALNCTMRFPLGNANETIYKASVVKLDEKGEGGGAVFDRCTMRLTAGWTGGWLQHSDRRFGLLNTPTPKGDMLFAFPSGPGWADAKGKWELKEKTCTAPLAKEWVKYRGMYLHGDRIIFSYTVGTCDVLDSVTQHYVDGMPVQVRAFTVTNPKGDVDDASLLIAGRLPANSGISSGNIQVIAGGVADDWIEAIAVADKPQNVELKQHDCGTVTVRNLAYIGQCQTHIVYGRFKRDKQVAFRKFVDRLPRGEELDKLTKGGPKRWGEPIVTKLERGSEDGPFAVDTITIPYKNRFNALFFCTGLDIFADGRIAVCTCHGDVWIVTVDEKAGTCSWQRYATGFYQPLGLKIIDRKVIILERGQLTRLHDADDNGEADFFECLNNDWHCGGGEHSYDTCLETDPEGNFYFFKTGDTSTPHGGCLMRVTKDGSKAEVFATGFRHPIGLGISPKGIITGADQEGNWMPATRIDEYKKGGFYGDMRAHHRVKPPTTCDPPLCWLPREIDNSAGGQVWVPEKTWGELSGLPLHFSYGRCKAFVLLRQELGEGSVQGGVTPLGVQFLSGVCRGRFHSDGHLYVCGLNGWQTAAQADGCLQRVRATGKAFHLPTAMVVKGNTIRLSFSSPLDAKAVASIENYRAAWWNYRYSSDYGSKRWKVSNPKAEGQDDVPIRKAKLLADERTIELTFDTLQPVMQMMIGYNVKSAFGKPVVGSIYLTIHTR